MDYESVHSEFCAKINFCAKIWNIPISFHLQTEIRNFCVETAKFTELLQYEFNATHSQN
jgi:hypothetical protein